MLHLRLQIEVSWQKGAKICAGMFPNLSLSLGRALWNVSAPTHAQSVSPSHSHTLKNIFFKKNRPSIRRSVRIRTPSGVRPWTPSAGFDQPSRVARVGKEVRVIRRCGRACDRLICFQAFFYGDLYPVSRVGPCGVSCKNFRDPTQISPGEVGVLPWRPSQDGSAA